MAKINLPVWTFWGSRLYYHQKLIGGIYDLGQLYKQKQPKCYKKIIGITTTKCYVHRYMFLWNIRVSATGINNIYWFIDTMLYLYHGFILLSSGINLITRCDMIFSLENIFDPVWMSEFRLCFLETWRCPILVVSFYD